MLTALLIWTAAASAVSFTLYGIDKRCAVRQRRRIPETTLLIADSLLGFPGGFIAQRVFRHKTRKFSYQFRYWAIVVLHAFLFGALIYSRIKQS